MYFWKSFLHICLTACWHTGLGTNDKHFNFANDVFIVVASTNIGPQSALVSMRGRVKYTIIFIVTLILTWRALVILTTKYPSHYRTSSDKNVTRCKNLRKCETLAFAYEIWVPWWSSLIGEKQLPAIWPGHSDQDSRCWTRILSGVQGHVWLLLSAQYCIKEAWTCPILHWSWFWSKRNGSIWREDTIPDCEDDGCRRLYEGTQKITQADFFLTLFVLFLKNKWVPK